MTMWMARGDAGRLYEEFRERGVAAIGWAELIDAKPGMSREQLIAKYAAAHPDFKRGHIISGASIDTDRDARDLLGDVEARALEFIKDKLTELDWDEMQELTAGILRAMGYKTRVARPGPDRGADIVASPDGLGFEMPRIVVEVKHRQGQMGAKEVRSFLGGRHKDDRGLFVSTGGFSKDARYEADRASIPLALWDLDDLFDTLSRTTKHSMLR